MPQPLIADAYLQPSRSLVVHTTPGRTVDFRGGHARVIDHRDMPHLLAREDMRIVPTEWGCSWAADWLSHTRELKAVVEWPEGWAVSHTNQDDFTIDSPEGETVALPPEASGESSGGGSSAFSGGKGLIDMLLGSGSEETTESPAPMFPNHKVDCRCVRCKAARKRAA